MKIAIIGGGIGGLAAYHAIKKQLASSLPIIKIYESHLRPSPTSAFTIGGGLSLSPNGLRALSSISPASTSDVIRRGCSMRFMTFRNSHGQLLGQYTTGRKTEGGGYDQVFLSREDLHRALLLQVEDGVVEWGRKVVAVREIGSGAGVEIRFGDGSVDTADLVLGADGVRSVVREQLFGKGYDAVYDGFSSVGGILSMSSLPSSFLDGLKTDPMTMTFGPHGLFGYSVCTPASASLEESKIVWWSMYEAKEPPQRDTPLRDIREQLLERHSFWTTPYESPSPNAEDKEPGLLKSIIRRATADQPPTTAGSDGENRLLILPRYVTPPLPRWSTPSGRIILIGDAAHAMPPDSGQGACSTIEDAVAIGLLLKHHCSGSDFADGLAKVASGYEEVRRPWVNKILDMTKMRSDNKRPKTRWQEMTRDWALWVICKLPWTMNSQVYDYDVEREVREYISRM